MLLDQPRRRADVGTPAQSLVETGYLQGRGVADEYLAREIKTQTAVLQLPHGDATRQDGACATARLARFGGAPTAGALLVGMAHGANATADARQCLREAVTAALPRCTVPLAGSCAHRNRYDWLASARL